MLLRCWWQCVISMRKTVVMSYCRWQCVICMWWQCVISMRNFVAMSNCRWQCVISMRWLCVIIMRNYVAYEFIPFLFIFQCYTNGWLSTLKLLSTLVLEKFLLQWPKLWYYNYMQYLDILIRLSCDLCDAQKFKIKILNYMQESREYLRDLTRKLCFSSWRILAGKNWISCRIFLTPIKFPKFKSTFFFYCFLTYCIPSDNDPSICNMMPGSD